MFFLIDMIISIRNQNIRYRDTIRYDMFFFYLLLSKPLDIAIQSDTIKLDIAIQSDTICPNTKYLRVFLVKH